jgi:hypothetical protein
MHTRSPDSDAQQVDAVLQRREKLGEQKILSLKFYESFVTRHIKIFLFSAPLLIYLRLLTPPLSANLVDSWKTPA